MHISCSSPFSSHPSSSLPLEKKVLCLPLCLIYFLLSQTLTLTLLFALCSNTPEIMDKSGLEEDEERGLPFPNNGGSEQRSETEIEIKAAFPPLPTLCSGRKQNLFSPLFFFPPFGRSLKVRQLLPIRVVFGRKKGRKQIERAWKGNTKTRSFFWTHHTTVSQRSNLFECRQSTRATNFRQSTVHTVFSPLLFRWTKLGKLDEEDYKKRVWSGERQVGGIGGESGLGGGGGGGGGAGLTWQPFPVSRWQQKREERKRNKSSKRKLSSISTSFFPSLSPSQQANSLLRERELGSEGEWRDQEKVKRRIFPPLIFWLSFVFFFLFSGDRELRLFQLIFFRTGRASLMVR